MSTATATASAIGAGEWKIDPVHSNVGFSIKHMVVATFRGSFESYDGQLAVAEDGSTQLVGAVRADSLAVKDENLAAHLRSPEFFDTDNYPELRFESSAVNVHDGEVEVEGDLTIKDHTHRVSARGTINGPHVNIAGRDTVGVELEAVIDRRDYGLEWNAPLPKGGFALENDVKLQVVLELSREA